MNDHEFITFRNNFGLGTVGHKDVKIKVSHDDDVNVDKRLSRKSYECPTIK